MYGYPYNGFRVLRQHPCEVRNDLPIISFVLGEPHHGLRSLNGGNNGQNIGIFLVPAKNEGRGRRIGAKAVLPGLVHPTWPDHSWGSLGRTQSRSALSAAVRL